MNPTFRQLRAFAEIARLGSFTEAAGQLSLTQSATSGLLRELERQLGLPLVDRTTRRASLTAAGSEFLVHARRILADVEQAVASTQGLLSKSRGRVAVAASPLIAATLMPEAIRQFQLAYPGVTIALYDVLTDQILQHVRSGTADFGVGTFESSHTELELITLFEDRLGAVVPTASGLGSKSRLKWSDLQDQPNIALTATSAFRSLIDATCQQLGLRMPAPRFEVGYMGTAVALVEAGLGLSVLPERAAALFRTGGARWLALGKPLITQSAMLVKRAGKSLSPAAGAFAALLAKKP